MEARRLFQAIAHRQTQLCLVGTLGEYLRHVRVVERPQGIKYVLRLGQLVAGRSETVDDMSRKQRRELVEAYNARVLRDVCGDPRGAAIATSSMATDLIKGKTIDEALKLTNKAVVEALEGLPPIKVHCSVLAEQAVKAALSDYYRRQGIDPEPIVGKLEEDCDHCESCGH